MEITLNLTVEEVNGILASLGKQPFDAVSALIVKIKQQGEAQIQASQAAEPVAAEPVEAE